MAGRPRVQTALIAVPSRDDLLKALTRERYQLPDDDQEARDELLSELVPTRDNVRQVRAAQWRRDQRDQRARHPRRAAGNG